MSAHTLTWWQLLCAVSVLNLLAWLASATLLRRRAGALAPRVHAVRQLQLLLSAGYVLGCAYRSVLPVFDVQRLCLFDTWFSSVIVGRSVATVAELCFAAQWALLLRETALAAGSGIGRRVSQAVLPLIVVAECCSWYSVLTLSNLGHVIEESIWGLSAALLAVSLLACHRRVGPEVKTVLGLCGAAALAYVLYMFAVDVPMYWTRWLADEAMGRRYLDLPQGVVDASTRWVVSHHWDDWKSEVVWMSAYFSVAVWLSIGLVHAPLAHRAVAPAAGSRGVTHQPKPA